MRFSAWRTVPYAEAGYVEGAVRCGKAGVADLERCCQAALLRGKLKVAERDAHVHLLKVPARLGNVALAALFVEMHLTAADHGAPGLQWILCNIPMVL